MMDHLPLQDIEGLLNRTENGETQLLRDDAKVRLRNAAPALARQLIDVMKERDAQAVRIIEIESALKLALQRLGVDFPKCRGCRAAGHIHCGTPENCSFGDEFDKWASENPEYMKIRMLLNPKDQNNDG